ncbi:unnamed protein product [Cuscuta campestris]|uniref:peptidylprolyl isomerase n=1 Tax=Cuscuta campestris TaxID=132261 RepID=A0A484MB59_9ASTE|nr:unnamed protein product [Cuscuta campestris]
MDTSLLPTTKQHESLTTRINDVTSDVADGFQSVKKHSNKKAKVGDDGMSSVPEADSTMNGVLPPSPNDKGTDPESGQSRSFSNGLIVEDLAKGNPDGRVATTGRKVKVHFTGMLWENGHTFTPSGATFRFCLGDKGVLPGWNIGIEGMRVGDKRRLTIPPLLGYGSEGFGEQIPPNSWLVYDIELVSVHR